MTGSISIGWRSSGRIPRSRCRIFGLLSASLPLLSGSATGFAAPQNHADEAASSPPPRIAIVGATLIDPERVKKAMADPNYVASRRQLLVEPALKNLKKLQDAGVKIAAGTDAGNIGTLHGPSIFREFELMAKAGLTPMQILTAATVNASKVFAENSEVGTIDPGMLADLVILRANPLVDIRNASEIETVIKDGVEYRAADLLEETPSDVVQRQVNAYNARNMEAFITTYSSDAKLFQYPNLLVASGREEIRTRYERLFSGTRPLHAQILQRISAGRTVIDQERSTGLPDARTSEGFVIYEVTDRLIRNVTLIPTGE
jgi:hypothetical protein